MRPHSSTFGSEYHPPAPLLEALATAPAPLTEPRASHLNAALLMADIAGFKTLSAQLAERGSQGSEQFSRIINAYFTRLIGVVSKHGGSVVNFTGDTLLALWPVREDSLEIAAFRAAECAHIIQKSLTLKLLRRSLDLRASQAASFKHDESKALEANEASVLSLRLGISAGDISTLAVGGVLGRWEFVVMGEPVLKARRGVELAGPAQTVLAPEVGDLLRKQCITKPLEAGYSHVLSLEKGLAHFHSQAPLSDLETRADASAHAAGTVPPQSSAQATEGTPWESGQTDWFADLRQISLISINIPEISEQSPDILRELHAAMVCLQRSIHRYEASVAKLTMDPAGLTLLVVLGLPPLSHPDDPLRAVKAALAMQAQLKEFGFTCNVGVTSGRAFCGTIPNCGRREYTMIGEVVNSAERLMFASKGDVYCDLSTLREVEKRFEMEALPPVRLKGQSHEVPVFRPVREKRFARKTRSIVGRIEERKELENRLAALANGRCGGAVLLESEAGMGKSELIAHLISRAAEWQIQTHIGFGNAVDKSNSGHAWIDILRALLGVKEGDNKYTQSQAVLTALDFSEEHQANACLLNDFLQLDFPESEPISNMPAQARSEALRDLLVAILQEKSTHQPLLLVMEDVHWLDSTSRKWLLAVRESLPSVLMVLSVRTEEGPTPAEWESFKHSKDFLHLRLGALSKENIVDLVCEQLGVFELPSEITQLLASKAEGHPLFAEELGQTLVETGILRIEDDVCSLVPGSVNLESIAFPTTLAGVIRARIDRLNSVDALAIKTASICGRVFSVQEVEQIFPLATAASEVADSIERLAALDLTPRLETEPAGTYIFKHALIQDVAYDLMMFSQRAALHRALAQWLEFTHSHDIASQYARLAHHWSLAGDDLKAVDFYEKAAAQATARFANEEAIHFYQCAIALEAKLDTRLDPLRRAFWYRALAESQYYEGHQNEGLSAIHAALELLHCPTPNKRWLAFRILREALTQVFRRILPASIAPSMKERKRLLEIARLNKELSRLAYHNNDISLLLYGSVVGLNYAERAGPSNELAPLYITMALNSAAVPGFQAVSNYYLKRTAATLRFVENPVTRAWVQQIEAVVHLGRGKWEKAHSKTLESVAAHKRYAHRRMVEEGLLIQAYNYFFTSDFIRSSEFFMEMECRAESRGDQQCLSWARQGVARSLLRMGEIERPLTLVESARPLIRDQLALIDSHGAAAFSQSRAGNWAQALEEANTGFTIIHQSPQPTFSAGPALSFLADTYISALEHEAAPRSSVLPKLERLSRTLRQYAWIFPFARAQSAITSGFVCLFSGKQAKALSRWRKGLRLAEEGGMPFEQGRLHLLIALHGSENQSGEHYASALRILSSSKADWLVQQANSCP
jgi:class 3 adenylate cyclase